MEAVPEERRSLRFLLDTNVVIALEPFAGALEERIEPAADLLRLILSLGHIALVHPATEDDMRQDTELPRRMQRLSELRKYERVVESPVPARIRVLVGSPTTGSNGDRDLRILNSLVSRAADFLVTEDRGLHRWSARVGREDSVVTVDEAVELLRNLAPSTPTTPPLVDLLPAYAINAEDPILDSVRRQYGGADFDAWLDRFRGDHSNRSCYVVRWPGDENYAALALVKWSEPDNLYSFPGPVTKVSTFKVSDDHRGRKYGELLLKAIFLEAADRAVGSIYVECFPEHEALRQQLAQFGFDEHSQLTDRGELVLVKTRRPKGDLVTSALGHHVLYGPPAISGRGAVFAVPIQPRWHDQLFPDAPSETTGSTEQLTLIERPTTHPWGNALRKAYLCHSRSQQLSAGDSLLFYLSGGRGLVLAVGVVEATLRSGDPTKVLSFVGQRTVYSPEQISRMCARVGGVLAVRFRQDRFIDPGWSLAELQQNAVLKGWPQSVTKIGQEGTEWVHQQLRE